MEADSKEVVNRNNTPIMSSFYLNSILREPEVSFDFDTSSITRDNLDEFIQKSRDLFSQRPATEPCVRAIMMFESYLH